MWYQTVSSCDISWDLRLCCMLVIRSFVQMMDANDADTLQKPQHQGGIWVLDRQWLTWFCVHVSMPFQLVCGWMLKLPRVKVWYLHRSPWTKVHMHARACIQVHSHISMHHIPGSVSIQICAVTLVKRSFFFKYCAVFWC